MAKSQNLSGINFERGDPRPPYRSMIVRIVSIGLLLLALAIVAFQLFNPIKPRPSLSDYVERYNAAAEKQQIPGRLPAVPSELMAGTGGVAGIWRNTLPEAGMTVELLYDETGHITGANLTDDGSGSSQSIWLTRSPKEMRNQIYLVLYAIDPKQSIAGLYRTFDQLGVDLDQPISAQKSGTGEASVEGLNLTFTHDSVHFRLAIRLDVLEE